jgi:Na+/H+ antiporter NhaA
MKVAFGGVAKMLTGKKYPQSTRTLRLVVDEILRNTLCLVDSYHELLDKLFKMAEASRTSKHWVNNLILPVFLIMIFCELKKVIGHCIYKL